MTTTDKEIQDNAEIDYWCGELIEMYESHLVELDYKDCKDIMDLLIKLENKLKETNRRSQELRKRNPYIFINDPPRRYGYNQACDELEKMEKE